MQCYIEKSSHGETFSTDKFSGLFSVLMQIWNTAKIVNRKRVLQQFGYGHTFGKKPENPHLKSQYAAGWLGLVTDKT